MAVYQYLDVSTAHITKETMNQIVAYTDLPAGDRGWLPIVAVYPEGAFLWVPEELQDHAPDLPADLNRLLKIAKAQGCHLIRLDADADVIDGLMTYEW